MAQRNPLATIEPSGLTADSGLFSDARIAEDVLDRFWSHVDRSGDCWEWTAFRNPSGYGQFVVHTGLKMQAHRFIDGAFNGEHKPGECTLHKCDNPSCVRPSHLFRGTQADNMQDKHLKGRTARGERIANSKLTEWMVAEMRRLRDRGEAYQRIADRFGVSIATAHNAINRKHWQHVN